VLGEKKKVDYKVADLENEAFSGRYYASQPTLPDCPLSAWVDWFWVLRPLTSWTSITSVVMILQF